MKKKLLTTVLLASIVIFPAPLQTKKQDSMVMPILDDEDEMSEYEAAVAATVEFEEQSWFLQWFNKIGSETAAACIHCKRYTVRCLRRLMRLCVGPKRLKLADK